MYMYIYIYIHIYKNPMQGVEASGTWLAGLWCHPPRFCTSLHGGNEVQVVDKDRGANLHAPWRIYAYACLYISVHTYIWECFYIYVYIYISIYTFIHMYKEGETGKRRVNVVKFDECKLDMLKLDASPLSYRWYPYTSEWSDQYALPFSLS